MQTTKNVSACSTGFTHQYLLSLVCQKTESAHEICRGYEQYHLLCKIATSVWGKIMPKVNRMDTELLALLELICGMHYL